MALYPQPGGFGVLRSCHAAWLCRWPVAGGRWSRARA